MRFRGTARGGLIGEDSATGISGAVLRQDDHWLFQPDNIIRASRGISISVVTENSLMAAAEWCYVAFSLEAIPAFSPANYC
jgi:hypothetical protein